MAQSLSSPQIDAPPRLIERVLRSTFHYLRLVIGCFFIVLGILGVILPVLPGTVWFIVATLIIGRRSRVLRRASISGKRFLRRWALHENRLLKRLGIWSLAMQCDTSRRLRRVNWWLAGRQNALRRRFQRA